MHTCVLQYYLFFDMISIYAVAHKLTLFFCCCNMMILNANRSIYVKERPLILNTKQLAHNICPLTYHKICIVSIGRVCNYCLRLSSKHRSLCKNVLLSCCILPIHIIKVKTINYNWVCDLHDSLCNSTWF